MWRMNEHGVYCPECWQKHCAGDASKRVDPMKPGCDHCSVCGRDYPKRDYLIEKIEGYTGSLKSVPWNEVNNKDMYKLLEALEVGDILAKVRGGD